ncbi:orotate phosphoribosyltransferase [Sediminibacillus albus]|uniref:Orotate phosphoribosyltransferase n=1 Tax=Sediminibacillus albus TaxID=407036 RepID=A0A1G8W5I0_9BACI|nr:orotate phosphoribosyltransferase [Sediminibacillus albus]SDJ73548.1 orotate phosphoribosyltransferase [Sediminibacillus albus]
MSSHYEIANDLLSIGAVKISPNDPFTWTSGIKSPIYCDNRLTMSYPEIRKRISSAFKQLVETMEEQPDVIAGCATAGIPHAAWLAGQLDLPMVYVRSKPKAHGKGNQIEGQITPGRRVIVIEDLISTGGSSLQAAQALQDEGFIVLGVAAIFSYGLPQATQNFDSQGLALHTITNFDILVGMLAETQKITAQEKHSLLEWRNGFTAPL